MKPTQQDIIEFAKQAKLGTALSHGGGELRIFIEGADWHEELLRFAALLLERFGAGGGEPVAFIQVDRHGEEELLWTKDDELEGVLYGYTPLYTHPSPTDLRAEYLRGLEDAAKVADDDDHVVEGRGYYDQLGDAKLTAANIRNAIEALKGKQ